MTFAPVAKISILRLLLAIAACENLDLHQTDVKPGLSNGDCSENIYMEQPDGFVDRFQADHVVSHRWHSMCFNKRLDSVTQESVCIFMTF